MARYLAFVLVSGATVGVVAWELTLSGSEKQLDLPGFFANNQRVQQELVLYRQFKTVFRETCDSLCTGEISLKEATSRVYVVGNAYCPNYLSILPISDPGKTIQESIARNLVGHVAERANSAPRLTPRVLALEAELQEFTSEMETASSELR